MFENQLNNRNQRPYKIGGDKYRNGSLPPNQYLSPEQVAELILKRPELRLADNPATVQLAQLVMATPEDPHAQELFQLIVRDSLGEAIVAEDEFLGNYPPKGSILYTNDFISLGTIISGKHNGHLPVRSNGGPTRYLLYFPASSGFAGPISAQRENGHGFLSVL